MTVTDKMILAFLKATDNEGAEKGSHVWKQIERGLRAVFALRTR